MDADEIKRDAAVVCHWYEEAPRVVSSTRIFTAVLIALGAIDLGLLILYVVTCVLRHEKPDANTVAAIASPLAPLIPSGAVAIYARNKGA